MRNRLLIIVRLNFGLSSQSDSVTVIEKVKFKKVIHKEAANHMLTVVLFRFKVFYFTL